MECSKSCAAMLRKCQVGGLTQLSTAGGGFSVGGDARCLVEKCKLMYISGGPDGKQGKGAAVFAMGNGKVSAEQSTLQDCAYCFVIYDHPRVIVRSCKLTASSVAFEAHEGTENAALLLQKTQVRCQRVWSTSVRPGRFETRDCDIVAC
mmetsp:Transcript_45150/g.38046  ORF Transcript_45150/g.38046 Transcript_45150/m.38046 type:complete len:149 (+) Transcript_45150:1-447(+)